MVGFGSSLRMSRRRGWEDAYLDYASLRLLLTQIEAVYEEEDWKAHNNSAANSNTPFGSNGNFFGNGAAAATLDDDDGKKDDHDTLQSILRSAWEKTRSVLTGRPYAAASSKRRKRIAGRFCNTPTAQRQQRGHDDSEYFEYSPSGPRLRRAGDGRRVLLQQQQQRSRGHHNRSDSRRSGEASASKNSNNSNAASSVPSKRAENQDEQCDDDDGYNYDDRALDKGGWRAPGVLDYRDELFLESDDDLAFGYCFDDDEEEDDEETTTEDEDDGGEWVDEDDEEEERGGDFGDDDEENTHQYSHFEEDNLSNDHLDRHHHSMDIIAEKGSSSDNTEGDESNNNRLVVERASSDDSNIKAELATISVDDDDESSPSSPDHHHHLTGGEGSTGTSIISKEDHFMGMGTPISQLPETPISKRKLVHFTESPGVLEAGYETFAVAAARRGEYMGGSAEDLAMCVGSPSEQGNWFDFIPNLLGNNKLKQQQHQQKGESMPLLLQEAATDSPSPEDNNIVREDSFRGGGESSFSFQGYTSLRSKTSSTRILPAPRSLSKKIEEEKEDEGDDHLLQQHGDDIESKFSYGTSLFLNKKENDRDTSTSSPLPSTTTRYHRTFPVMATAIGSSMPATPTTPPFTPPYKKKFAEDQNVEKGIVGFGVPIQMIPTEAVELLRPNSPLKSPTPSNFGASRFYSFQNDDTDGHDDSIGSNEHDERGEYNETNMISFYSSGGRGGDNFSLLRSPPNTKPRYSYRQHQRHASTSQKIRGSPLLSSDAPTHHQFLSENPIMNLLLGRSAADWENGGRRLNKTAGKKKKKSKFVLGHHQTSRNSAASNTLPPRPTVRQTRAAAAAKSKRSRTRRKQRQMRRKREERIPQHLRAAHVRAAAITERFRGLLRAEVEKVILFANSRLGELSDTIGCLRYSSYEDEKDERKTHPNFVDGGIHQLSSSDEEDGGGGGGGGHHASDSSSSSDEEAHNLDVTIEQDVSTRRQIIVRDRIRMMRPLFQKADFLGDDFSLLSAVDEADAYAAVGVELMHLLKFVCVNIIAVRKICKKHDRLLSNRMLGGYYQRQAAEAKKSQNQRGVYLHQFHWNEPQFGTPPAASTSTGGYIYGIYDSKIQHIANSTTMQTVSSSLSIALADFEASQSRSARLELGFEPSKEIMTVGQEVPTPRHKTSSKSRGVLSYQLGGHCFSGDDESSFASQEKGDDNESTSSNIALTRLQFVVTSVFGLREAARIKVVPFEQYASRLFMTSTGPNVVGDGLDGCSRETLDLLCSYNPDAAYTLDSETLHASLRIGRENEGIKSVMVASLAVAAKGCDATNNNIRYRRKVSAAMSIKPQLAGEGDYLHSSSHAKNRNILGLNAASMVLFLVNYYCVVPIAHIHSIQLGSVGSSALLIGAANTTSMIASIVHASLASKRKSFAKKHMDVSFFRTHLILSALFPLIGNILHSLALKRESLKMALVSRLLVGLGSAEVLNRRLVSTIIPKESVNAEVARLVKKSMLAMTAGLLLGALVDVQVRKKNDYISNGFGDLMLGSIGESISDASNAAIATISDISNSTIETIGDATNATIVNTTVADPSISTVTPVLPPAPYDVVSEQPFLPFYPLNPPLLPLGYHRLLSLPSIGIIMAFLWFIQLIGLVFFFDAPSRKEELVINVSNRFENTDKVVAKLEDDFDSDSARSERVKTRRHVPKPSYDSAGSNLFVSEGLLEQEEIGTHGTFEKLQTMSRKTVKTRYKGSYIESIACVRRLAMSNIAFPTTVFLLFLARAAIEALLSSCATIMYRFFWCSGAKSGLFMGVMTSCILPINFSFSSEKNFTERSIIKTALVMARCGLVLIFNYEALFHSIKNGIFGGAHQDHSLSYDSFLGTAQYIVGFAIVFMSMVSLESVTLILMSKVSPVSLRKYSLDSSFAVIFVSSMGRLAGDVLFWIADLSSRSLPSSNIINTLCCCLIICLLVGSYFVKKHYFFLI